MASQRGPAEREPTVEEARQDAVKRAAGGMLLATVSGALLVRGMGAVAAPGVLDFFLGIVLVPLGAAGLFGAAGLLVKAVVVAARVGMTRGPLPTAEEVATEQKERRERAVADD
jgi:hypothetical protein